ncbi:MAG: hypothetical protein B7Y02_09510, partial [Rhodobacterales bacterium 17-64-5]
MPRILLLGGTTEANLMARAIADAGLAAVYSYAGRTEAPMAQPIHMRVGGFGGVEGLQAYLVTEGISHVIDATHPFAAGMSTNAVAACTAEICPLANGSTTSLSPTPTEAVPIIPLECAHIRST